MRSDIVIYIPTEDKESTQLAVSRLLGVPLFLRPILTLAEAGYKKFTIIAPIMERRHILKAWNRYMRKRDITPHFIWSPLDQKIDAATCADLLGSISEQVCLINANLLLTQEALEPWKNFKIKDGQYLQAKLDRGMSPLIKISRNTLSNLISEAEEQRVSWNDLLKLLTIKFTSNSGSRAWQKPAFLLTRFSDRGTAVKFITEQIRLNSPGVIARHINKRISLPLSTIMSRLRISPNTITSFNMLVGLAASIGAAGKTYIGLLWGAIFFQLASILDGCDGEVAKLTHRTTKFGQYIDSISDNLALAGFITGLMIHEYRVSGHSPAAFLWGGALLGGFFILLAIMINFLKRNTDSASFATFDKEYLAKLPDRYPKPLIFVIRYGKYLMKKDLFSFMFLISAIFGLLPMWLYLATVGTWTCILILSYLNLSSYLQERRQPITPKKNESTRKETKPFPVNFVIGHSQDDNNKLEMVGIAPAAPTCDHSENMIRT